MDITFIFLIFVFIGFLATLGKLSTSYFIYAFIAIILILPMLGIVIVPSTPTFQTTNQSTHFESKTISEASVVAPSQGNPFFWIIPVIIILAFLFILWKLYKKKPVKKK